MLRKILITNDDGIAADGIVRLARIAKEFGDVWVVAPDVERSASSHCISLRSGIEVRPYDFPVEGVQAAYSCSGTPADCVRVGMVGLMPVRADVVLAGVNKGYNCATDIQYSGTCGAAFEGAFQGALSIAFSEPFSGDHAISDHYLRDILEKLITTELPPGRIWNVNFPECSLEDCNGILWNRKVSRGMFYKDSYDVIEELENGGKIMKVHGHFNTQCEEGTDMRALVDNYVSVGIVNNFS